MRPHGLVALSSRPRCNCLHDFLMYCCTALRHASHAGRIRRASGRRNKQGLLFLYGVYVERPDNSLRFRWVRAPSSAERDRLTQTLVQRIGRHLERQGLLERDAENSYPAGDGLEAGPLDQILGLSITYRIAVGPRQGRKVFTLQTLPACDDPIHAGVGKVAGFHSVHPCTR